MDIYFTGSIRGGREHVEWYAEIVKLLKNYGKVLTEHVADVELPERGEDFPVNYIFERDIKWIKECDTLVADVTTPSVGVGYEIARAELLNKPVLCLFYEGSGKRLSGMVEGNKGIKVERYKSVEDIFKALKEFFEGLSQSNL